MKEQHYFVTNIEDPSWIRLHDGICVRAEFFPEKAKQEMVGKTLPEIKRFLKQKLPMYKVAKYPTEHFEGQDPITR